MGVWTPGPGATAGDDTFTGDATNESADGLAGDDVLNGNGGDDTLSGGDGADIITPGFGNDEIHAGAGDDRIVPLHFSESWSPGLFEGDDAYDGGDGNDTLSFFQLNNVPAMTADLAAGFLNSISGQDVLISIENVAGTFGGDDIRGSDEANILYGSNGDDILHGRGGDDVLIDGDGTSAGADQLVGHVGDDLYVIVDADTAIVELAGEGVDTVHIEAAFVGVTRIDLSGVANIENYEITPNGSAMAELVANDANNVILAGAANFRSDVISFFSGNDDGDFFIHGGGGDDVIHSLLRGDDFLFGNAGDDEIHGGDGNDRVGGNAGADTLFGDGGDDSFAQIVETSVDQLSGGAGFDTIDYSGSGGGVIVQLSGYATTAGGALLATFSGMEAVIGSSFSDALIGNGANNVFEGGAGADWLVGADGDDRFVLRIGSSIDRLFGGTPDADSGFDTIDYSTAGGGMVVQLSGYATNEGLTLALFSGVEAVIGSSFSDALIGTAANNRIEGGFGDDWLVGQGGDDWFVQGLELGVDRLFGDAGVDTIDYSSAGASIVVQLNGWSAIAGGAALATFTGIENAVGSAFDDALIGSVVDNRIESGAGADWLVGGGGNDTFVQTIDITSIDRIFGGAPGADSGLLDTIDYSGASQGVVVQLSGYATTNGGGVTLATFSGVEGATGSTFADALIGNAAANRLTGGLGGDWLVGGGGADTFVYQALESTRDSIRDFASDDLVDLAAIDANPTTGADDAFAFATVRHAGVVGEAVVANFGGSSLVSLYLDGDNIADMTIQVVHGQGVVMSGDDFVL